ncbi:AbrB/MazE/SpoVT family DNA-binding domain-containing protein [Lysobacter sp. A03]|uniref:AbrB/MazE/SpoVT family DNA-binding domain-containing protein n=1 Tax=Lysobacter sp. A03 TaxID=1199154 RepID=UPI0005B6C3F5|nr:AbrB/MazE/SpoVT family DNA-binding domain-containing protein [Lysobacter sp. A03]KIQ96580.1 hypothetical protein TI01_2029 [Lysobacter sp. A03]
MDVTVAERGQITLPKAVRDALGLSKGTLLKVELEGSRIILSKSVDDALSRVRGKFELDRVELDRIEPGGCEPSASRDGRQRR